MQTFGKGIGRRESKQDRRLISIVFFLFRFRDKGQSARVRAQIATIGFVLCIDKEWRVRVYHLLVP